MPLTPRGPLSAALLEHLARPPHRLPPRVASDADEDDLQVSLYLCYELHYRGLEEVDPEWEWEPSLLDFRRRLERVFEAELLAAVGPPTGDPPGGVAGELRAFAADDSGPPLSRHLAAAATAAEFREFVVHRSAYHLKESDPHSWGIPRLDGRAKAALVEIQADEYGGGRPARMHSALFAAAMRALGLDPRYGAYLDVIPGVTLATVNLMSLFGLHRRWRGALAGHLALFEMTSSGPNRRYARGLRRLGYGPGATGFFDEHVEADAVHELIALNDLAGALAEDGLGADVLFGARSLAELDRRFAGHLLGRWEAGLSSLRRPLDPPLAAAAGQ